MRVCWPARRQAPCRMPDGPERRFGPSPRSCLRVAPGRQDFRCSSPSSDAIPAEGDFPFPAHRLGNEARRPRRRIRVHLRMRGVHRQAGSAFRATPVPRRRTPRRRLRAPGWADGWPKRRTDLSSPPACPPAGHGLRCIADACSGEGHEDRRTGHLAVRPTCTCLSLSA